MKKIFWIVAALTAVSCAKEKDHISTNSADSLVHKEDSALTVADSANINVHQLDKFGFPPEVEGCSCYFAQNKEDFQKENFVYVDDYGNHSYIKINGKLIKIQMEEGDFDLGSLNRTIENSDYKIHMTGKKISEMEETIMFEGELNVENKKTGEIFNTPIYGECGC